MTDCDACFYLQRGFHRGEAPREPDDLRDCAQDSNPDARCRKHTLTGDGNQQPRHSAVDPVGDRGQGGATRDPQSSSSTDPVVRPQEGQWQPIATAPKDADALILTDGTTVDVGGWVSAADQGAEPEEEFRIAAGWWFLSTIDMQPTHWQPLPLPPSPGGPEPVERGKQEA